MIIAGASPQYNGYYGDSGTDKSYPEYNVSNVLTSLAGSAIDKISKSTLKVKDVIELREKARVMCQNVTEYPKCFDRCLFNVYRDPCESTDLSSTHRKVRKYCLYLIFIIQY